MVRSSLRNEAPMRMASMAFTFHIPMASLHFSRNNKWVYNGVLFIADDRTFTLSLYPEIVLPLQF